MPAAKVALLLGGSSYGVSEAWLALPDASRDVQRLERKLRRNGFCVLTDPDASSAQIQLTVNAAAEQIDVDTEIVLIHWVGHGAQVGQHPVLVPIDAQMPDGSDATMLEDVLNQLSAHASLSTLFIVTLDCCRGSNVFESDGGLPADRNFIIMYSCKAAKDTREIEMDAALANGFLTQAFLHFGFEDVPFADVVKNIKMAVGAKTRGAHEPWLTSASMESVARAEGNPLLWSTQQLRVERSRIETLQAQLREQNPRSEAAVADQLHENNLSLRSQLADAKLQMEWTNGVLDVEATKNASLQGRISELETSKEAQTSLTEHSQRIENGSIMSAELQSKTSELQVMQESLKEEETRSIQLQRQMEAALFELQETLEKEKLKNIELSALIESEHDGRNALEGSLGRIQSLKVALDNDKLRRDEIHVNELEVAQMALDEERSRNTELEDKQIDFEMMKESVVEEQRRSAKLLIELSQERGKASKSQPKVELCSLKSSFVQLEVQRQKIMELEGEGIESGALVATKEADLKKERVSLAGAEAQCSDLRAKLLQDVEGRQELETNLKVVDMVRREIANRCTVYKQDLVSFQISAMRREQQLLSGQEKLAELARIVEGRELTQSANHSPPSPTIPTRNLAPLSLATEPYQQCLPQNEVLPLSEDLESLEVESPLPSSASLLSQQELEQMWLDRNPPAAPGISPPVMAEMSLVSDDRMAAFKQKLAQKVFRQEIQFSSVGLDS